MRATTIYKNTRGESIYLCDQHASVKHAKAVSGPYETWENGAVVGGGTLCDDPSHTHHRIREWAEYRTSALEAIARAERNLRHSVRQGRRDGLNVTEIASLAGMPLEEVQHMLEDGVEKGSSPT